MTKSAMLAAMTEVLDLWLAALDQYSEETFVRKPNDEDWSIGQVYQHLVLGTRVYHMRNIASCLNNPQYTDKLPTDDGLKVLTSGEFPPHKIRTAPSPQYPPPQPEGVAQVREQLTALSADLLALGEQVYDSESKGRMAHMRFGFLNASEWYHLIEMHFRHHLRQKENLDQWLAGGVYA